MARLFFAGAEARITDTVGTPPDGQRGGAGISTDTAVFRTGSASYKGLNNQAFVNVGSTFTDGATRFVRTYFFTAAAPSVAAPIMGTPTVTDPHARLRTDGAVELVVNSVAQGSPSASIADSAWHRVEMQFVLTTSNFTSCELRVDGATVATWSGTQARGNAALRIGWVTTPTTGTLNWDDIAINDSSGAANNTWAGDGGCILMLPISDNSIGAFVAGLGGTTNHWDAVNNTPPVGVAEASATNTSQIKNRSATNPTSCDLNLATYTAAGVTGTVNAIQVFVNTGEDPATGTKAGTCAMVSNPAIGPSASFNYGNDVGLQGTYIGNWFWSSTAISDAPSVTLGTAPVIRVTCTSGATTARSASVDFLGALVDFTPSAGAATSLLLPNPTRITRKR